ncbi:sulfatase [Fodinibius sediminis]|uniref:Arylsulfatase A n=1 Tax=Fodinibius sediminis TaxID=1214077 RepID=A0A521DNY3_9BACT|nr:sulfatase [Fodinibius sediminis]SMO73302.1 Arylsulfatase A [Fodinibius sediminis]
MNYYTRMKGISVIMAGLLLLSAGSMVHASEGMEAGTSRPNILLINIDDLGWKDLGYMGSSYYETPNVDRLAARGMVFSQAYASAANCAPSRAALFSGMWTPRTGIYTVANSDRGKSIHRKLIPTPNTEYLADSVLTIAELLQQGGYRTAHAGKWHLGEDPADQGFEVNIAGLEAGNPSAGELGGYFAPYNNPYLEEGPEGEYLTDRITSEAISFLESTRGQPFFLNYAPYIVHTPIQPKEKLKLKYEQKLKGRSANNPDPGYAAMVETMDANVGRLVDYLMQAGRFENTLIIFTSDNGGLYRVSRQEPLRAGKGAYYEGGIRVPLIICWPGRVAAGSVTGEPVTNLDFYPTILAASGLEKPAGKVLDGTSLLPLFRGERLNERYLYWHFPIYLQAYKPGANPDLPDPYFRTRPGSVIRKGPWKLHEYFEDGRIELYNLETDIGERKDLKELYPERAGALYRQLKQWRRQTGAPVPTERNPRYRKKEE